MKVQKGLDWLIYRMSRLMIILLALGAIFGFIGRCQSTNAVSKNAIAMAKTGAATPKNLALLDGEKATPEKVETYQDVLNDLGQKCREPEHELIYMATSLSRRYRNAKREVNNYDAMIRLYVVAKGRQSPTSCKSIYAEFMNLPNRKLP